MKQLLRAGDKIRLRVPLLSGYKGVGFVLETQAHPEEGVIFRVPGCNKRRDAARNEVSLCRDNEAARALAGQERIAKKNRRLIKNIQKEIESVRKN
jgi:hypothetical protein